MNPRFPSAAWVLAFLLPAGCGAAARPVSGGDGCGCRTASEPSTAQRTAPEKASAPVRDQESAPVEESPVVDKLTFPERLDIQLLGAEKLYLARHTFAGEGGPRSIVQLEGRIGITVANPSGVPVKLVHMSPANLVFTRVDTGEQFSLLHPCDPGLLLGSPVDPGPWEQQPEARVLDNLIFVLGPGETRVLEMGDEWGCSGGPWRPVPEPGEYTVQYRIHRFDRHHQTSRQPEPHGSIGERLDAARALLASEAFWQDAYRSDPVRIVFEKPRWRR